MRRCVLAIAAWLAAFPATAQEVPKPTAEGKAALEKLVGLCVEAGGLKREPLPGGKGERLVVVDAPKVDVAVVKAANGLPVRPLCDAMVARIGDCDPAELGTYMGLVKCLAEKTGDRRTVAFAVFYESWENGVGGRSKEAAAGFIDASRRFGAVGEPEWQAASLTKAGAAYHYLNRPAKELECVRESLAIYQRLHPDDHRDVAGALNNVGFVYWQLSDPTAALSYLTRALAMYERLYPGGHAFTAASLNNVGSTHDMLGDPATGLRYHFRALTMRERLLPRDPGAIAESLNNVGTALNDLGDAARGLEYHLRALATRERLVPRDPEQVAQSHTNVGYTYDLLGDATLALAHHLRALRMYQDLLPADDPSVARSLNNIGGAYQTLHDGARALDFFRKALAMRQRLFPGDHADVANSLNNLGNCYLSLGEPNRALEFHTLGLEMRQRLFATDHPEVARSLSNVGAAHSNLGDPAAAIDYYGRALRALRLPSDPDRGGGPLTASRLRPLPLTLGVLQGRCYILRKGLPENPTVAQLRACEHEYALAAAILDRLRGEVQEREASKLRQGEQAAELVPERIGLLTRLYALDRKPDDLRAALLAAEQGRARVLLESLTRRQAARLADAPAELRDRESAFLREVRACDARIRRAEAASAQDAGALERLWRNRVLADNLEKLWRDREAAEAELNAIAARLRTAAPRYADLRYPKPCTVEDARAALGPGEVALHFVLGKEASYLVLLAKEPAKDDPDGGLAVVELPPRADVERRLAALLDEDTLKSTVRAKDAGADLYGMLLGPVAVRIKGKHLVIIPDGPLCYLPFQLLVDRDDRYLAETHRVRYAPSLTTLHLTRKWAEDRARRGELPDRPLYAVGDPDYGPPPARPELVDTVALLARLEGRTRGEAFAPLEHSGREVAAVADLLGKADCRVLLGDKATEAMVKADSASGELARYRYVHFACHGVLGRGPGQPPGLALGLSGADGKDDGAGGVNDGPLRADEVLNLRLNADLVVLSACRSGRGRLYAGEGVEGLARAFLYAGTRGVVSSLWSVDDAATAGLMAGMYGRLKGGAAADALREAQLAMIREGRPPFHWAPFVLVGE